jgi:Radial spokehead-like protein
MLQKSLKQLAASSQAGNLRLWGKIQGTNKDYYIAEGTKEGAEAEGEEKPPGFEARGTGVNKWVYWATNSPLESWTQLPDLAPSDVQAAREVKVHFSGELERRIVTNPFFFKREKHFLRAQISRITFATNIAPKGLYKVNDENQKEIEEIPPNDEGKPVYTPTVKDLGSADNWVHFTQNILKCNRLVHTEIADDNETGDAMKKVEAADPYERRLKPITQDARVKGGLPAWTVRSCGEHQESFGSTRNANVKVNFGTVVVRSLQWPGAYTFFNQGRW